MLTDSLFSDPEVKTEFVKAGAAARSGVPLRLRLLIAPSAPELHALRWETLLDPVDGTPLLTNSNVLFSRYLTSTDWRPVRMRLRSELRALIVVADPRDLAEYAPPGRAPAGPGGRHRRTGPRPDRARTDPHRVLPGLGRPTLSNLVESLRERVRVVYLVCHGYLVNGEPQVVLEREDGTAHVVHGHLLVQRLKELQHLPRLVVLASCQSATRGDMRTRDDGAVAALGPQLIEIGVPAVLAMQGDVTMRHGRAVPPGVLHAGCSSTGESTRRWPRPDPRSATALDWWAPTLFMRLHSGRLWYAAGFARRGFARWPAVVNDIWAGTCLPLLGPGMTDTLLGPRQQLARDMADRTASRSPRTTARTCPRSPSTWPSIRQPNFPGRELRNHLVDQLSRNSTNSATIVGRAPADRFRTFPRAGRTRRSSTS